MTLLIFALAIAPSSNRKIDVAKAIKADMIPLSSIQPSAKLDDLKPIGKFLKDVQVVGIGEATHGTSEFCTMKHRMFRYLVEEQGFTVFGLEASMPDCIAMDDYVMNGKGDPKAAVKAQGFWTWSTQELLDLITWMRAYNQDSKHTKKLRVFGYDMQSQVGTTRYFERKEKELTGTPDVHFWEMVSWNPLDQELRQKTRVKMDGLIKLMGAKLGEDEAKQAKFVEEVFFQSEKINWLQHLANRQFHALPKMAENFKDAGILLVDLKLTEGEAYEGLKFLDEHKGKQIDIPVEDRLKVSRKLEQQLAALGKLLPGKEKVLEDRISEQCRLLSFLAFGMTSPDFEGSPTTSFFFRDQCMARNIERGLKELYPDQKMMVWAHNGHIMRMEGSVGKTMGGNLDQSMGKKYYPIGFSFSSGRFNAFGPIEDQFTHEVPQAKAGSLDDTFLKSGIPLFFLPLHGEYGTQTTRQIGAYFDLKKENEFYMELPPSRAYSALIFIAKTTPTHLLK